MEYPTRRNNIFLFIVLVAYLVLFNSCKKEESNYLPLLTTGSLTNITSASAECGGIISSDGGNAIIVRGVCWNTEPNPTIYDFITRDGNGTGRFTSTITGLTSGTNYYVRAYATNSSGTAYGNEFIFITPMTDIEGNVYNTVIIGTQVWTTSNLKTTRFNDNTPIPLISNNSTWSSLSTPGYCWYKNDEYANKNIYGALYNWFAVNTGRLCPAGWHVPNETEWLTLAFCLGGEFVASGKLKEKGTLHWKSPNTDASDEFGFTALPGGYRTGSSSGSFRTNSYFGWWWTSTEFDTVRARARLMTYDTGEIARGSGLKNNGYSVRCVKD